MEIEVKPKYRFFFQRTELEFADPRFSSKRLTAYNKAILKPDLEGRLIRKHLKKVKLIHTIEGKAKNSADLIIQFPQRILASLRSLHIPFGVAKENKKIFYKMRKILKNIKNLFWTANLKTDSLRLYRGLKELAILGPIQNLRLFDGMRSLEIFKIIAFKSLLPFQYFQKLLEFLLRDSIKGFELRVLYIKDFKKCLENRKHPSYLKMKSLHLLQAKEESLQVIPIFENLEYLQIRLQAIEGTTKNEYVKYFRHLVLLHQLKELHLAIHYFGNLLEIFSDVFFLPDSLQVLNLKFNNIYLSYMALNSSIDYFGFLRNMANCTKLRTLKLAFEVYAERHMYECTLELPDTLQALTKLELELSGMTACLLYPTWRSILKLKGIKELNLSFREVNFARVGAHTLEDFPSQIEKIYFKTYFTKSLGELEFNKLLQLVNANNNLTSMTFILQDICNEQIVSLLTESLVNKKNLEEFGLGLSLSRMNSDSFERMRKGIIKCRKLRKINLFVGTDGDIDSLVEFYQSLKQHSNNYQVKLIKPEQNRESLS